jgi:hypothetical protein
MEDNMAVAVEVRGKIVEVVSTTEEYLNATARFVWSRWYGAEELKLYRCTILIGEEIPWR